MDVERDYFKGWLNKNIFQTLFIFMEEFKK